MRAPSTHPRVRRRGCRGLGARGRLWRRLVHDCRHDCRRDDAQNGALAYSHCMRSHGVPDFPDPDSSGTSISTQVIPLVSSPQFQPAQRACVQAEPIQQRQRGTNAARAAPADTGRPRFRPVHAASRVPRLPRSNRPGPVEPADGHGRGDRPSSAGGAQRRPGLHERDPRPADASRYQAGGQRRLTRLGCTRISRLPTG